MNAEELRGGKVKVKVTSSLEGRRGGRLRLLEVVGGWRLGRGGLWCMFEETIDPQKAKGNGTKALAPGVICKVLPARCSSSRRTQPRIMCHAIFPFKFPFGLAGAN